MSAWCASPTPAVPCHVPAHSSRVLSPNLFFLSQGAPSAHWGSRVHGAMLPCCPCYLCTHTHRMLLATCWLTVVVYNLSLQCLVGGVSLQWYLGQARKQQPQKLQIPPLSISPCFTSCPQPGCSFTFHCGLDRDPRGSEDSAGLRD